MLSYLYLLSTDISQKANLLLISLIQMLELSVDVDFSTGIKDLYA